MSLSEVWDAAAANSFTPTIGKERQFLVGFTLLLTGRLSPPIQSPILMSSRRDIDWAFRTQYVIKNIGTPVPLTYSITDLSLKNVPLLGVPASLAFG